MKSKFDQVFAAMLIVVFTTSLTACAAKPAVQQESPTQSSQPVSEPTPETTAEPVPEPEPEPYEPMDIFGGEFNPFGMDSPFTVFSASFNKGSVKLGKDQFVLSMTGGGNMYACMAYLLDVSGLGLDDGKKMERLEEYRSNGYFLEFTGTDGQVITIRQASPDDNRYEYVEANGQHGFAGGGCVIDITYFIDDADVEKYTKLVSDNYDLKALAALSDYMDVNTDFSECGFGVNLHKQQAASYVVYYLPDVAEIQKNMESGLSEGWWEWNGMMQTSIQYGAFSNKLTFDAKDNAITIEQTDSNFSSLSSGQTEAEVSLTKLGFGFATQRPAAYLSCGSRTISQSPSIVRNGATLTATGTSSTWIRT